MKITISNVFPTLAQAVAGLEASEEDWAECAPYMFLADIRRFLCERAGPDIDSQLRQFGHLLEKLLLEGDQDIHDLVMDSLEGLATCQRRNSVAQYFLPQTLKLWMELCKKSDVN